MWNQRAGRAKNSYRAAVDCIHGDVADLCICASNITRRLHTHACDSTDPA